MIWIVWIISSTNTVTVKDARFPQLNTKNLNLIQSKGERSHTIVLTSQHRAWSQSYPVSLPCGVLLKMAWGPNYAIEMITIAMWQAYDLVASHTGYHRNNDLDVLHCCCRRACQMVANGGSNKLVPYHVFKSLQLVWYLVTSRWIHLQILGTKTLVALMALRW